MKTSTENISFEGASYFSAEEARELFFKLSQIKQKNMQKDKEIQALNSEITQLAWMRNTLQMQNKAYNDLLTERAARDLFISEEIGLRKNLHALSQAQASLNVDNMSYEQILEMQQQIGYVSKGLNPTQVKNLRREKFIPHVTEQSNCSVCQDLFTEGTDLVILKCKHTFHDECITQWFQKEKVCPLCKKEAI